MRLANHTYSLPQLILAICLVMFTSVFVVAAISSLPIEGTPLGWDWQLIWTPIQNGKSIMLTALCV